MPVKERLIEYLKHEKISHTEFGKAINVSASYINGIRKSIQPDKILSIAKTYTSLNIEWLLTGKGEMLKNSLQENEAPEEKHKEKVTNTITIPQEIWDVIKNQAECLKIKDKESQKQGERIDRLITLLEKKNDNSSDGGDHQNKKDAI